MAKTLIIVFSFSLVLSAVAGFNFDMTAEFDDERAGLKPLEYSYSADIIKFVKSSIENATASLTAKVDESSKQAKDLANSALSQITTLTDRVSSMADSVSSLSQSLSTLTQTTSSLTNSNSLLTDKTNSLSNDVSSLSQRVSSLTQPKSLSACTITTRPKDCKDLQCLGHVQSGFYTVRSGTGEKAEMVFCDFSKSSTDTGFETRHGYNDVKSKAVYFLATASNEHSAGGATIIWDNARLNIGSAYNPNTGIFTAPVSGVYYFAMTVLTPTVDSDRTAYALLVNNINTSTTGNDYVVPAVALMENMANPKSFVTMSTQTLLSLKAGDTVLVKLVGGKLDGSPHPWYSFSGSLIEENLSL